MKKKAIYRGGGFRQHQYLYMLPIIDSFCKKNKINTIIIERKLIKKTFTHPMINKIKKRYNIVYLPDLIKRNKVEFKINLFFVLIYFFLKYFFIKGKNLREKDTWISTQIKHSIWDFAIKINKDKFDSLELLPRLKSIYYSSLYYCYSLLLLKYYKIDFSFFQHFVYFERTLFANLRRKKVTLIQKSFHVLRVQKKNYDLSSNYLDKKIYKNSFKFIKRRKIQNYWKEYLSGRSKYLEAKQASVIKNKSNSSKNVIFLHVFRDSPFICIDQERIFDDYFHWFISTLKIIKNSHESWQIRIHPSSIKWGENPNKIINYAKKEIFNGNFPKNISIVKNKLSNLENFKNAKRIVTYAGHSHLEAACFGIKPIIISNTSLCDIDKGLIIKPKNFLDYKDYLLKNSDSNYFKLNQKQTEIAKRVIFILHNCCDFKNQLKSKDIFFKRDDKSEIDRLYNDIFVNLKKNDNYFKILGSKIYCEINQSLNLNYINKF